MEGRLGVGEEGGEKWRSHGRRRNLKRKKWMWCRVNNIYTE